MEKKVEFDEEKGIKAIIWLQKSVGIIEPESLATINWRNFTHREKRQTMEMYNILNRENDGEKST